MLTTTSPNQEDGGLSLELSLRLPNASSTQEVQPTMQNPNQENEEKVEEEEEVEKEEEEAPTTNPNQEDGLSLELSLGFPTMQNPNQENEEKVEEEEEVEEAPAPAPIPVFMFEKVLTYSDVVRNPNRLLIRGTHVYLIGYLTKEEVRRAYRRIDFLRVVTTTTENNGDDYILHLKRWYGAGAIVFKHQWGKLVRANALRIGDYVVGWGYRLHGEFRLLLNITRHHLFD